MTRGHRRPPHRLYTRPPGRSGEEYGNTDHRGRGVPPCARYRGRGRSMGPGPGHESHSRHGHGAARVGGDRRWLYGYTPTLRPTVPDFFLGSRFGGYSDGHSQTYVPRMGCRRHITTTLSSYHHVVVPGTAITWGAPRNTSTVRLLKRAPPFVHVPHRQLDTKPRLGGDVVLGGPLAGPATRDEM